MKNKKGVSQAIEYVLFFSFVVAMMTLVFFWGKGRVDTELGHTVDSIEGSIECADVRMNLSCSPSLVIGNNGVLTIDSVAFRSPGYQTIFENISLKPLQVVSVSTDVYSSEFEVVPVRIINGKTVLCTIKAMKESC